MNCLLTSKATVSSRIAPPNPLPERRALDRLLTRLDQLAENSDHLMKKSFGEFKSAGQTYTMPRYLFLGPQGGGDTIRIGIFATIHGDEPEGALALTRLVAALEKNPELAKGYCLFLYPVCNPTGFEDNTRHSRNGLDLNREFWKDSAEPEVRLLETEIWLHAFDGIITLHADDTSDGLYGYVAGAVLSENLLEPALREAEGFLPRNRRRQIDGFAASDGIITQSYPGVLRAPRNMQRPPFEITLETPQKASLHRQVEAFSVALQTILVEYRCLMAIAQNI
ncbi:MAG TPA: M14 family metallocarboxypeptidase [Verrucomicrobiae bacterium]|nr:M14 family metallocarboxypeptidase [Verrucomicrobiae bacterium]